MSQRAQNHCNSGSSVFRAAIVIRRPYAGSKDRAPVCQPCCRTEGCVADKRAHGRAGIRVPGCARLMKPRMRPTHEAPDASHPRGGCRPTRTRPARRHRRRKAHLCAEAGQKYLHERGTGRMPTEACGPRISERPCDRAPVCQPRCQTEGCQTEGRMDDAAARGRAITPRLCRPGALVTTARREATPRSRKCARGRAGSRRRAARRVGARAPNR